jgi:hypothetical protein
LWINASSFSSKKIRDWDCFAWRRRFSQSKFHFDFEDDLRTGIAWFLKNFFVDKRFIFFFKKDSRLGLLRLASSLFSIENFILISKTTCPRHCVTFGS